MSYNLGYYIADGDIMLELQTEFGEASFQLRSDVVIDFNEGDTVELTLVGGKVVEARVLIPAQ